MKFYRQARKYGARVALATAAVAVVPMAHATGPDYSAITDAISFDGIEGLVIGAAAALIAIGVVIKGIGFVRRMVGG